MAGTLSQRLTPGGALFSTATRSTYRPTDGLLNISLDYNAAPSGTARGTEVIIPDNASPEVRAAAEAYNSAVVAFARDNGIADYPNRGVRTRSENGRGVRRTMHVEPFFNTDMAMQEAIKSNPSAFAALYRDAFGGLSNARVIAPHGVGADRGATSSVFGTETDFGRMMIETLLSGTPPAPAGAPPQPGPATQPLQHVQTPAAPTPTTPGTAAPTGPTFSDRMGHVGAALMAMDQGQTAPVVPQQTEALRDLFARIRGVPGMTGNGGLSL